ncbi:MAG: lamin tail domain-containing protein [Pseudomonadota bacterium]|nr:lamin tail domain-containing protein [Pseudomonadota bacterium]
MILWLLACSERFETDTGDTRPVADDSGDTDPGDTDTGETGVSDLPLELCINEFMVDNESSLQDETLAWPDWIELHNPGNTRVELDGWSLTDTRADPDKHVLTGGLAVAPGGFTVLWADDLPAVGVDHLAFRLGVDGGEVALYAPDGRGSVVTYGELAADFSVARVPDCCEGEGCLAFDFRGTPGVTNVEPVYEDVPLLPTGSTWKYWDAGVNPGAGWEQPGFDDAAWASGAAPLGYGDAHQVTVVSYGADPALKHTTTWFRTSFAAPDIELASLAMGVLRDDGAVVYLNGVEIARDNLPEGDLADATFASASTGGTDETVYWEFDLAPGLVEPGTNTLAVALHQSSVDSSDLGFDLTLTGERLVTE